MGEERVSFNVLLEGKTLFKDSTITIFAHKGKLHIQETDKTDSIIKLPLSITQRFFCFFRILIRLFRLEPRLITKVEDDLFLVSFLGNLYSLISINNTWKLAVEHHYREGMNNPLSLIILKDITGFSDCVIYGEYWGNQNKEAVRIMRRLENDWSVIYTFPEKTITHIHGLVPDSNRGCVYILTGDEDSESGIWEARDNFTTVKPIIIGKQVFRSCVAFPTPSGLLYATDTPLEKNSINLLVIDGPKRGMIEKLSDINGSCIYGTSVVCQELEYYVFSTTVEGDSKKTGLTALLSRKRGLGILTNHVECLCMQGLNKKIYSLGVFKKDHWPFAFQFGSITFSTGSNHSIYGTPIAVKGFDGKTLEFFIDDEFKPC